MFAICNLYLDSPEGTSNIVNNKQVVAYIYFWDCNIITADQEL